MCMCVSLSVQNERVQSRLVNGGVWEQSKPSITDPRPTLVACSNDGTAVNSPLTSVYPNVFLKAPGHVLGVVRFRQARQ